MKTTGRKPLLFTVIITILINAAIYNQGQAQIFDWAITELHYQYGNIDTPEFAGGGDEFTHIFTLQHANSWKYGDNFFFIDFLTDSKDDNFNDSDYYGELYSYFSISKISGKSFKIGPISDIGLLWGLNIADDPKVIKYLPGFRLSWDIPGFTFLNTTFSAYLDRSSGINSGGAPKQFDLSGITFLNDVPGFNFFNTAFSAYHDRSSGGNSGRAPEENDSFMIDVSWAYPINISMHSFSIEGHIEYIGKRDNEFGKRVSDWFFGQTQFRYDLGKTLFKKADRLFIGTEWQFWINKLGDSNTHENTLQALVVLRY